jgi:hypothetical protein
VHDDRQRAGEDDACTVERLRTLRAGDAIELPRAERCEDA